MHTHMDSEKFDTILLVHSLQVVPTNIWIFGHCVIIIFSRIDVASFFFFVFAYADNCPPEADNIFCIH